MAGTNNFRKKEPGIRETLQDDLNSGDFFKNLKREWAELKEFFIDDDRREQLKTMGGFKKFFVLPFWLLKSLFLKMNTVRRMLFIFSIVLMFLTVKIGNSNSEPNMDFNLFAAFVLIFILMLELKDKLLAKSELREGRSVQEAMMPEENPAISGWDIFLYSRPANDVGGDMVDYLRLGEKRNYIALGDVSGKGLGAALFMVKLQSTLRAMANEITSPAEICDRVNSIFHRDKTSKSFASLVYVEVEDNSDKLKIVNAGHMPPKILSDEIKETKTKGMPAIGLMKKPPYSEEIISFNSGDAMIIYSDGVTEARNPWGDFLGEDKFETFLGKIKHQNASMMGKRLLAELEYFIDDASQSDDISIAILKKE